jgi:nucleotide-binding universal stress UspA family protein
MMARKKSGPEKEKVRSWILVGVDFSRPGRRALIEARSLARRRDAALLVLHVIDGHALDEVATLAGLPEEDLRQRLSRERRKRLGALLIEVDDGEAAATTEIMISWGTPFEEILKKAADFAVDLIVLGTAGRTADLERALFGSTAEKVLRATPCPVLCVPSE